MKTNAFQELNQFVKEKKDFHIKLQRDKRKVQQQAFREHVLNKAKMKYKTETNFKQAATTLANNFNHMKVQPILNQGAAI